MCLAINVAVAAAKRVVDPLCDGYACSTFRAYDYLSPFAAVDSVGVFVMFRSSHSHWLTRFLRWASVASGMQNGQWTILSRYSEPDT